MTNVGTQPNFDMPSHSNRMDEAVELKFGKGELAASRLMDACIAERQTQIPWKTAINILGICTDMSHEKMERLKNL